MAQGAGDDSHYTDHRNHGDHIDNNIDSGNNENNSSSQRIDAFFEELWRDYVTLTPRVAKIRALLAVDNASIANDHVAFRSFDRDPIRIEQLEGHLLSMGYRRLARYRFTATKLDAWGYLPPRPDQPRVFLSALRVDELSAEARAIIDRLCEQIDPLRVADPSVFHAGVLWPMPTWQEYRLLQAESEYAAWLSALGMRANHFTISVNSLRDPATLEGVIERVEAAGFSVNAAGGKLKGSPEERLEQASTLADRIRVRFGDHSEHEIPSCYYEFARRYPGPTGDLYQGFVAASADRIFESTDG